MSRWNWGMKNECKNNLRMQRVKEKKRCIKEVEEREGDVKRGGVREYAKKFCKRAGKAGGKEKGGTNRDRGVGVKVKAGGSRLKKVQKMKKEGRRKESVEVPESRDQWG